jgi:UDPglucose 6-dehydrogenase
MTTITKSAYEAAAGVDAILVLTEWEEFKTLDYQRIYASMNKPAFIFDGRLILDNKKLKEIGFQVKVIGKTVL